MPDDTGTQDQQDQTTDQNQDTTGDQQQTTTDDTGSPAKDAPFTEDQQRYIGSWLGRIVAKQLEEKVIPKLPPQGPVQQPPAQHFPALCCGALEPAGFSPAGLPGRLLHRLS